MSHKLTIINSSVNYFEATRMIQTFDTGPFLLSLKRAIKKIRKALNIPLLQFLTKKHINLNSIYS